MRIDHSLTIGCFAKAMLLASILSTSSYAADPSVDYCQTPVSDYEPDPIAKSKSSIESSLENINDLQAINERGMLRVLLHKKTNGCSISKTEFLLIEEFANINDLDLHWIYVENKWDLLSELLNGKGDLIAGQHQDMAAVNEQQVSFSQPWSNATYKIVGRADNSRISRAEDLAGREIAVYKNSPAWNILQDMSEDQIGMNLKEIPQTVSYEQAMDRVKSGEYDLAIIDSLFLDNYLPVNIELQASFSVSEERNMAWAIRSDAENFQETLNQYLNKQHLTLDVATTYFEDLPLIKDKGILRVITNANPSHYFLHKGKLKGFEYEFLNRFASKNMLRLDVVLADSSEEMFQLLKEGKGDVIAASLPSSLINTTESIEYTSAYNYAAPVVVGRDDGDSFIDFRDLTGRRITLSEDSPYWDFMMQLKDQGMEFELVKADEGVNMEGALLMVALGMYDLTVIGNHQLNAAYTESVGLNAKLALSEPVAHRWALRADDQQLNLALNNFIEEEYRTANYNVLHAKYFESGKLFNTKERITEVDSISPYDEVTQEYSEEYGFDWRLITALMFQESQFNPTALSSAGAEGLMQLIPSTAEFMGVSDTTNAESSINAGIRYLNYIRAKFEEDLLLQDRIWFTLASYNAGYGRVKQARILAEEMGLDKDKWFDNVEIAMMGFAKPYMKDGEQVRYCRCGETVVYVREIRTRYFNYIRLTDTLKIASNRFTDRNSKYLSTIN